MPPRKSPGNRITKRSKWGGISSRPDEKKAKRKLKNYKIKNSRLLTCYSSLLYLLFVFDIKGTVSPDDAKEMTRLSPTERLEYLADNKALQDAKPAIDAVLAQYDQFLRNTNAEEGKLVEVFMDREQAAEHIRSAYDLGNKMFEALDRIGKKNPFHRLIVV